MNESKVHVETVSNGRGSLGAAGVGGDDDGFSEARDVCLDIFLDERLAIEVVDGDIEEALVLGIVQVHGDDVVGTSAGEKISNERTGLGDPLLVAGLGPEGGGNGIGVLVVVRCEASVRGGGALGNMAAAVTGADAGHGIRPLRGMICAAGFRNGGLLELLGEVVGAIAQAIAARTTRTRRGRHALKGVVLSSGFRVLGQGRTGFVIGPVGLSRVGEKRNDGGDSFGRAGLAGRDHDAKVDEVVVDVARARLDDEDILATYGIFDFAAAFSARELGQNAVAGGDAEEVADICR